MRIAFHVPRAKYLRPGPSGDPVLVRNLLTGLRERGHQIEVVSRLDARDLWRGRVRPWRLVQEAIAVRRRMTHFSPDAWLVFNPCVTYPDLFGWWLRPKRYVLFAADRGRAERLPASWRPLFALAHRRSLMRADEVAVFRPSGATRLRSLVPEERLHVMPTAVDACPATLTQEHARRRLDLPLHAPVILSAGRFETRPYDQRPGKTQWFLDLLTAVAQLSPDTVLALVGDGPGRKQIEEEAAKLEPEGQVRLYPRVENDEMRWFYAACDLFAYPSPADRPFLVILEAQAAGRPVVALATDSAKLAVEEGRTGLLGTDLPEFTAQLAALASDRPRCAIMGRAAREYVARVHSIETRVAQVEKLLLGEITERSRQ